MRRQRQSLDHCLFGKNEFTDGHVVQLNDPVVFHIPLPKKKSLLGGIIVRGEFQNQLCAIDRLFLEIVPFGQGRGAQMKPFVCDDEPIANGSEGRGAGESSGSEYSREESDRLHEPISIRSLSGSQPESRFEAMETGHDRNVASGMKARQM